MKQRFRYGDHVRIDRENDNENYDKFRDQVLRITHVARSTKDHPGFDTGCGTALYDLQVDLTGEFIPFSLYDWELEHA